MAQTAHRSQIPVPSSPAMAAAPPSPSSTSAFPRIPSSSTPSDPPASPSPASSTTATASPRPESTSSIPSYARVSKQHLPQPPKSSALARIQPSSSGPSSPYSRPGGDATTATATPTTAKEGKTSLKSKRMSVPTGHGASAGRKGGKGPQGPAQGGRVNGHARAKSEGGQLNGKKVSPPLTKPLSPRSSPLSALAPTFAFRPTAAPFEPSFALPTQPVSAAAISAVEHEHEHDHLSPLAPSFQPHSPVLADDHKTEASPADSTPAVNGLGLSEAQEQDKETPPSPSFKEMAIEAEDEAREDGEGDIAEESEPAAVAAATVEPPSAQAAEEQAVAAQEEPLPEQVKEAVEPVVEQVKEVVEPAVEQVKQGAEVVADKVSAAFEVVKEKVESIPTPTIATEEFESALSAEEAAIPQVTESTPLPEPLVHGIALEAESKEQQLEEEEKEAASHPAPTEETPLPEPLVQATLNAANAEESSPAPPGPEVVAEIPTTLEEAIPVLAAREEASQAGAVAEQEASFPVSVEEIIAAPQESLADMLDVDELPKLSEEEKEKLIKEQETIVERVEDKVEELAEEVKERVEEIEEKAQPLVEQARESVAAGVEHVKEGAEYVVEKVENAYEAAKEKVEETVEEWRGEHSAAEVESEVTRAELSTPAASEPFSSPSRSSSSTWEPFEDITEDGPSSPSPEESCNVEEPEEHVDEDGEGSATPTAVALASAASSAPAERTLVAQPIASTSDVAAPPASLTRRSSSPPPPPRDPNSDEAPSLTLAIVSAWRQASWAKKIPAILASIAINFGLPFVNGVMLGFGELFARNYIGVRLGWGNPFRAPSAAGGPRANTSSVGLRASAPSREDHPLTGGAGVRTAVETAETVAGEAAAGNL